MTLNHHRRFARPNWVAGLVMLLLVLAFPVELLACPFCSAVSQTLRQEMKVMDAVVIAEAIQSDQTRDIRSGEVRMKVLRVLKGEDIVHETDEVVAIYFGDVKQGQHFMLSGVEPQNLQWSCLPVTERAENYVAAISQLDDDNAVARLRYYKMFLEDEDSMLARDAYDEFAITPYNDVRELGPEMDHDQIVRWVKDDQLSADRKRLYLTMLGVCGSSSDLPMLEAMLTSTKKSSRNGLDALIACYLTLAKSDGLPLIDKLFLNNKQSKYPDTYAAIMAVRFHGTEGDVIPRSVLVNSLHHVLDRKDLADLVIPDLARWKDWSQVDRLTELFVNSDENNKWVRVPVVNYLKACPLPEAKTAIEKLKEIDPSSVRRANTFYSIPKPQPDSEAPAENSSQWKPATDETLPADSKAILLVQRDTLGLRVPINGADSQQEMIDSEVNSSGSNLWQLFSVMSMNLASIVIGQYLILSGGHPHRVSKGTKAEVVDLA